MRLLITGGKGFIGTACIKFFGGQGHEITILTRDKSNIPKGCKAIENISEINNSEKIDVIINLAGSPIDKRWTKKYKNEIILSRVKVTSEIISLINNLETKPKLLINASAVGYYGSQKNNVIHEESPFIEGFTHDLCKRWEDEALKAKEMGVRVCITRLGVVLGKAGGMAKKITPIFKKGLGFQIGHGKQYFSWVHIYDVINALNFLIKNPQCSGVYNLTAPNPVTNSVFTRKFNENINLPTLLTVPPFVVKLLLGKMGKTLLLNGQNVVPKRLLNEGFQFKYNTIDQAIKRII